MDTIDIRYIFRLPNNVYEKVNVRLDAETLDLIADIPENLSSWTRLDYYQCSTCPLTLESHPNCLIAVHLVRLMEMFEHMHSYDIIDVDIITPLRNFSKKISAQKGLSSLLGLIMSTSGCSHMNFFKPMARFHLSFADAEERIYRATSMYLLAQYFLHKEGEKVDLEFEGLKKIYADIQHINEAMSKRLFSVVDNDVIVNALIILDSFAGMLFLVIEDSLNDVRYLFKPYLRSDKKREMNNIKKELFIDDT